MKIFGTISELVATVFRKNSQAVTFRPNQATTYTASRDIQMPQGDTDHILVSRTSTDTLTNKTFTSPTLTAPTSTDGSFTSVDTFSLDDTDSAFNTVLQSTSTNTADRTLTLDLDDGSRIFELSGNLRIVGGFSTTLTETGTTTVTLPTTGTLATLAGSETFTNKTLTSPTINTPTIAGGSHTAVTSFSLDDSDSAFNTVIASTSTNTADRTLTLDVDNGSRVLELSGDFRNVGGNSTTLTTTGSTNVTLPTTGTLATLTGTEALTNKTLDNTNTVTLKDTLFTIQDDGDTTKQVKFQATNVSTATTRTLTVPDANTTIVGTDATQSLTNKTLDNTNTVTLKDTLFTLQDDGDTTKQAKFQLSGITTGNTRTYTLPNASDTLVDLGSSQVLTNKDIDGGTATNSRRITLPKETTTNLNALTRKEATIVYDTTTGQVKFDNGTVLAALSTTATATPTTQGVVTSYFPVIQSSVLDLTNAGSTLTTTDGYQTVVVSTGASDRTVTLPDAAANKGRVLLFKKTDTGGGGIIVARAGSDTLEGSTSLTIQLQHDALVVYSDGTATWRVLNHRRPNQQIRVEQPNGYGSTNTKIRRFSTTTATFSGTNDIVFADSATNGSTFTINADGIYAVERHDGGTTTNSVMGISVNSNQLTTNIGSITTAHRYAITTMATANTSISTGVTLRCVSGDVIRAHDNGQFDNTGAANQMIVTQIVKF